MAKSIPIVGRVFSDVIQFRAYLDTLKWGSWRPRFVTMHHTGEPTFATWASYKARGITFEQWLRNLGVYYANPAYDKNGRMYKSAWSAGPHFFTSPDGRIGVLTPPTSIGVHAAQFNSVSWGLEVVGYFDKQSKDKLDGVALKTAVDAMAAMHLAMGWEPDPYQYRVRGLHFHRDDTSTSKSCPGSAVDKGQITKLINESMDRMQGVIGIDTAHEDDPTDIEERPAAAPRSFGVVQSTDGTLNVRASASQKAPVLRVLKNGERVEIMALAQNGATRWLRIGSDEWVAGAYIVPAK